MGLEHDALYIAADYGCQLGRRVKNLVGRGTENAAAAAIEFFRTEPIGRIVDLGREPPVQHSLAKLTGLSLSRLWDPRKINFGRDRSDWKRIIYWHKGLLFGIMRLFLWGDSDVARELGQIAAATGDDIDDIKEYFDVQRREEEIHSQFFQIALAEIFDIKGELAELERRFRWRAIPSFKKFFEELRKAVNQLQACPTLKNLVRVIAIYHMIAEPIVAGRGTLVVNSIFNQERYRGRNLLPGFRYGFGLVARDERQHVWAGKVALERLIRKDRELARPMLEALVEVAELAMGTDLPWLPEFPKLVEDLCGRLNYIGITPEAIHMVKEVYAG